MLNDNLILDEEFKTELEHFLADLGTDLLENIAASGDGITFGYDQGEIDLLLGLVISKNQGSRQALVKLYKKRSWLRGSRQIGSYNVEIRNASKKFGSLEEILNKALSGLSKDSLTRIARSNEPLTFTIHDKKDVRVEVVFETIGKEVRFNIFAD